MVTSAKHARIAWLMIAACAAMAASSCANPLAEIAASLRSETASPRIVVLQSLNEVASGGSLSVGTIGLYETVSLRLTVRNDGATRLVIPSDALSVALGAGTETGVFEVADGPTGIDAGGSAVLTLTVVGVSAGTKECVLSISTNDVVTPVFTLSIGAEVDSYARTSTPSYLSAIEGNRGISLEWQEVRGAEGYYLYWATSSENMSSQANKIFVSGNTYSHTGLENGTTLYYSVSTLGLGGESSLSEPISAMPYRYMVYVNNGGVAGSYCSTVGYVMDRSAGTLTTSEGSPYDVGSYPASIVVDPQARFAYISSFNTKQISCYTVDQDSGALSAISGSLVSAGSGVCHLAVDPSGSYLYAVNKTLSYNNGGSSVSVYAIDQTTGALTAISGSPFAVGSDPDFVYQPQDIVISPAGSFAYVPLFYTGSSQVVAVFSIDSGTGALTKEDEAIDESGDEEDYGVMGIALHPNGKFLYRSFWNNGTNIFLEGFTLNTLTGGLLSGQTTGRYNLATTSNHAQTIEIDPTGRFLYAVLYSLGKIAVYSIDQSTGALTAASGSPFSPWDGAGDYNLNAIGFDPAGRFAYIAASLKKSLYTGTLRTFAIDQADGHLSAVNESLSPGSNSCDIAVISLP